MAKSEQSVDKQGLKAFLDSRVKLPAIYDAKDFTNRPFTAKGIDWQIFEPTSKNNYNSTAKVKINGTLIPSGVDVIIESSQRGITEVMSDLEQSGFLPADLMIVQEGKYCTIVAAP